MAVASFFLSIVHRSPCPRFTARVLVAVSEVYLPVRYGVFFVYYLAQFRCRTISQRAAYRWHCQVRCPWWQFLRWSGSPWRSLRQRVCGLYQRRVSSPVLLWELQGCPSQSVPRLPWWHGFLWRFIAVCGWAGRVHPSLFSRSGHRRRFSRRRC